MRSKKSRRPAPFPWVWLLVGGALVFAALVGLSLNNATPNGKPQLSVSPSAIDLGNVKLGEWVTASFQVTNTGTAPLQFRETPYIEVAAGC